MMERVVAAVASVSAHPIDGLAARWTTGAMDAPARDLDGLLVAACQTREAAAALGAALPASAAAVVMTWAATRATRADLALAPLLERVAASSGRSHAAQARLALGPLHDALACLPLVFDEGRLDASLRRRVDTLLWEAAARGFPLGALGAWVWSRPEVVSALILDGAERDLASRVRAARALVVFADGFRDTGAMAQATAITRAVSTWMEHPEPLLWTVAARAAGRLAAHVPSARRLVHRWAMDATTWRVRRSLTAIAAMAPGTGADVWIDQQLDRALDPEAMRGDPWKAAAVCAAAVHLARDRFDWWDRVLELAASAPIEVVWSLAPGIAAIGRRGAGRGLTASEIEALGVIRERIASVVPRSTADAARAFEVEVHLAWATGESPPVGLAFESADDAIRRAVDGHAMTAIPDPATCFMAAMDELDAPDEQTRGRAHVALRSATRACSTRIAELATRGARSTDDGSMTAALRTRLGAEVCEYGLRSTLIGCLGDLVDAAGPGSDGAHGRRVATALRSVSASRWARELTSEATSRKASTNEIRRFRKPLEDLFDRCVSARPALRALGEATVPPPLAAWWVLCAGGDALVAELERGSPGAGAGQASIPALAALDRALADAALGLSPAKWDVMIREALQQLGAADTPLASAMARLASTLDAIGALTGDLTEAGVARELLAELAQVVCAYVDVAGDVDAALAQGDVLPPAPDGQGGATAAWLLGRASDAGTVLGGEDTGEMLVRWERELPARLHALIIPAARGIASILARAEQRARRPGQRIGGFELVEKLGGGGMGEVWKARRGAQLVALKLPHGEASPDDRVAMADALKRESGRLERLCVAKVATFIEAGIDGDTPYLATSYLRGRTWQEHAIGALVPRTGLALVRRFGRDVCTGLANLHELGIVHRDVTPRNVFLRFRGRDPSPMPDLAADPDGKRIDEAVLIDLGISQAVGEHATSHLSLGYVAPEILGAAPVGPAADVYALAATLFHVSTGRRFGGAMPAAAIASWHVSVEPFEDDAVRAAASHLPPQFVELLAAATRLEPGHRITLEAFDAALAEV